MNAHILLNSAAHCFIKAVCIGVNEEVLWIDRLELDACTLRRSHANSCHALHVRHCLRSWFIFCVRSHSDFTNACAIDFSHQLDVVNALLNLIALEIFHEKLLNSFHIHWVAVYIFDIIFNVKEFPLTKDGFNHFSMACFHSLLRGRTNDAATLALTSFVFRGPLTTEDTLILFPIRKVVHITIVTPLV